MKTLLYILHSGQRYGTEKMALATLAYLKPVAKVVLFAPPGPVHQLAAEQGISCHTFNSKIELAHQIWPYLNQHPVCICTTGVSQALIVSVLNLFKAHWPKQFHIVHGGTDERLSYGRKHWLQYLGIELVAVSDFVKTRLLANGCSSKRITVIENFLTGQQQNPRPAFTQGGIRRICMLTRIDPIKQVDVAITAWQNNPQLPELHICGSGWLSDQLQKQSRHLRQIKWHGFVEYTSPILTQSDLYLHTCDSEPFGLAILEAMDAGVPVLVPNRGGAAALVQDGLTGFYFRAGDSKDLARKIWCIQQMNAEQLNTIVANAKQQLKQRFSAPERIADYARLCDISGGE
ncbi:glycosyltransferase family 4 protein [Chitinibacter sp. SCUT-21]|uniref:glycosyltransferase family 4 protein n=1 Tax=Chitinibacter sp. SCUT-21 TaxID=2970891 RepID=UPI0035A64DD8